MGRTEAKVADKPASGPAGTRPDNEREHRRTKAEPIGEHVPRPARAVGDESLTSRFIQPARFDIARLEQGAFGDGRKHEDERLEPTAGDEACPGPPGHHLARFAMSAEPARAPAPPVARVPASLQPAPSQGQAAAAAPPAMRSGLLDISEPCDALEREADDAAQRVLRRLVAPPGGLPIAGGSGSGPAARRPGSGAIVQRASIVEVIGEATGLTPRIEPGGGLIVEDHTETLTPGQMKKSPFLRRLREVACETADRELRRIGRTAQGCPYIEQLLSRYARRPAAMLERAIRRYAPEASSATRAEEYLPVIGTRLALGVATWAQTGRMPEDLPDELQPGRLGDVLEVGATLGRAAQGAARALFKARPGGGRQGVDSVALAERLGPGKPLESAARSRMEGAFGHSFAKVRVHAEDGAASLARDLDARAFTVGAHIAFGANEYRPDTLVGDALLAHELAHVVQQSADGDPLRAAPERKSDDPDEREADDAAARVLVQRYARHRMALRVARLVSRVRGAPRLQRCSSRRRPDQLAGTRLPDVPTRTAILGELEMLPPVPGGTGASAQWDGIPVPGLITNAQAAANRDSLRQSLRSAVEQHLMNRAPVIQALMIREQQRVGVAPFQGACTAAKQVVDGTYGAWASSEASTLTPLQQQARREFRFQATGGFAGGQNIFDAADAAVLQHFNIDVSPEFRVKKLLQETHADLSAARQAMQQHHFQIDRTQEEKVWLRQNVQIPIASAHQAELDVLTRLGYARAVPGRAVLLQTSIPGGLALGGEQPSDEERGTRWSAFQVCAHEYIHTLEHPAFARAVGGRNAPKEMFTTFFTRRALEPILPGRVSADVRRLVEGGDWGERPDLIGTYTTPASYVGFEGRANRLRDALAASSSQEGALNAMRAAYFQGHIEFIGLAPTGQPGPLGAPDLVTVPPGVSSWPQLIAIAGSHPDHVRSRNPGISFGSPPQPGQRVVIPGARDHVVVAAHDVSGNVAVESKEQIARMNGVTTQDLERANPGLTQSNGWTSLSEGQRILIPRH